MTMTYEEGKKLEGICNHFLVENFYTKILNTEYWKIETITNPMMQINGIDVQIRHNDTRFLNIEEKSPQTHINEPVRTFLLETMLKNKYGDLIEGWFTNPYKETDLYVLYEIETYDKNLKKITGESQIKALNVMIFNAWDLSNKVKQLTGLNERELYLKTLEQFNSDIVYVGKEPGWFFRKDTESVSLCIDKKLLKEILIGNYRVTKGGYKKRG